MSQVLVSVVTPVYNSTKTFSLSCGKVLKASEYLLTLLMKQYYKSLYSVLNLGFFLTNKQVALAVRSV